MRQLFNNLDNLSDISIVLFQAPFVLHFAILQNNFVFNKS